MEDWERLGWKRLGDDVISARLAAGYYTRDAFAAASGVSKRTLLTLETGNPVSRPTLAAVERALGWAHDACQRILAPPVDRDELAAKLAALSPGVRQELLDLIDAASAYEQSQLTGDPNRPGHGAAETG